MSHTETLHQLEILRARFHREGARLDHDQRRQLLEEMERLADVLSYDDSGYDSAQAIPVVPPRHDRLTSSSSHLVPPKE